KANLGFTAAVCRIKFLSGADRICQFSRFVHQEPRAAVLDQIAECPNSERNHGRTTSQSLHRGQRTGFRYLARDHKTACSRQQLLFATAAHRTEKAMTTPQPVTDLLIEIPLMAGITERGARQ